MEEITLAGYYGWLRREKGLDGNCSNEMLMKYYPDYVNYVREKSANKPKD